MSQIRRVAVVEAGTMGRGIASHLANAGILVDLLDVASEDDGDRSRLARAAIGQQLRSQPPAFFHPDCAGRMTPGNVGDDLHRLSEADWIAEAVVERLDVKELSDFCDRVLGKAVVPCNDTPGFLGNRVGVFAIQVAITEAIGMGLAIEEAAAIMGRPVGWPKTGVFRLYDLIGLDLMLDVLTSMRDVLPPHDPFYAAAAEIPLIRRLVDSGLIGNKGPGGFYRRNGSGENAAFEAIDLRTGEYRPIQKATRAAEQATAARGLRGLVQNSEIHGRFAWRVLSQTLSYAASLVPEVSDSIGPIDEAMRTGFSWQLGPFEMIDDLGVDWFTGALEADDMPIPQLLRASAGKPFYCTTGGRLQQLSPAGAYRDVKRPPGVLRLRDRIAVSQPILQSEAASLWDIGDGVVCFEFHTKANAIVPQTMHSLAEAIEVVQQDFRALVIHNEGPHFSVGVNIQHVLNCADQGAWSDIERMLIEFQRTCLKLKYAAFPVIGAPSGMSLGGGFEVLLHCDALVTHTNLVTGLVETKIGLIPSGGGCKEMLSRWSRRLGSPQDLCVDVFKIVGSATTATSPVEASPFLFVLPHDQSVMNRDRILSAAKSRAIAMSADYKPPHETRVQAAGADGLVASHRVLNQWDEAGRLTPHDLVVGEKLARVLCGGDAMTGDLISEDRLLDLEREAFMELVKTPETLARIQHTLTTGKPLRN